MAFLFKKRDRYIQKRDRANRKPVWITLSTLYLDNVLDKGDLKEIALTIGKSPYSVEEIKKINRYELFPLLYHNRLSITGQWSGFNEEWLIESIEESLKRWTPLKNCTASLLYITTQWSQKEQWENIEAIYRTQNID